MEINMIYNKDCLKGLKEIPSETIDLIITSPPYNLGNNHHTGNYKHSPYDDDMKEENYQKWQVEILNECYRVLKKDGSMMYNHKNRIKNGIQITPYEWLLKTKFTIKQEIVWINRSQNFDKVRFYPWTERVYWLAKSPKTTLNNSLNKHDVFDWNEWEPEGAESKDKRAFPLQMALDLIEVFPESKLILDPFMGSGTTAIAAKISNKNFIGFETKEEYVDLAYKKLGNIDEKYYKYISQNKKPKQQKLF